MEAFLFLVVALISEVLGTVGGFGSSVFFVPLADFFFDFQTVLAITGVLHVFSNSAKLILFRKNVNYRLMFLIGIPSVLMVILGAQLTTYLSFKYTELILGIFLILFSILFFIYPHLKVSPNKVNAISGGSIAGFLAGLIGTGGAIRAVSLTAFSLEKNTFIATSAAIDFGVDFSRSFVYLGNGYLETKFYWYIPFLFGVAFLGSYIGMKLLKKVSEINFKKIVLVLLLLIGITQVVKTFL
jgi:uncharacterized membrane protein YfcA